MKNKFDIFNNADDDFIQRLSEHDFLTDDEKRRILTMAKNKLNGTENKAENKAEKKPELIRKIFPLAACFAAVAGIGLTLNMKNNGGGETITPIPEKVTTTSVSDELTANVTSTTANKSYKAVLKTSAVTTAESVKVTSAVTEVTTDRIATEAEPQTDTETFTENVGEVIAPTEEVTELSGQNTEKPNEEKYKSVLDACYDAIVSGNTETNTDDDFIGIAEMNRFDGNVIEEVGYAFCDLNGDGSDELIIGTIGDFHNIIAMYSIYNDNPKLHLHGWSRNRYGILNDNTIVNQGSSGASNSTVSFWHLYDDSSEIVCEDMYFTDLDDSGGNLITYHNTTGDYDKSHSEIVSNDYAYFSDMNNLKSFDYTPFADYNR